MSQVGIHLPGDRESPAISMAISQEEGHELEAVRVAVRFGFITVGYRGCLWYGYVHAIVPYSALWFFGLGSVSLALRTFLLKSGHLVDKLTRLIHMVLPFFPSRPGVGCKICLCTICLSSLFATCLVASIRFHSMLLHPHVTPDLVLAR